MNLRFTPVLRLTLWYTLIIMVISVMFSAIIYHTAIRQVRVGLPPRDMFFQQYGSRFAPPFDENIAEWFEERYAAVVRRLRVSLFFLNLFVLGGAGFASYFLAKRTLKPIEEALGEQRKFTADASHELRTPLAAMKTEIEVALHGKNTHDHVKVLSSNLEEIGKLEQLSSSLLTLARHEDDQLRPSFEEVHFTEVVEAACRRVKPVAQQRGIAIEREGIDGTVTGDRERLTDLLAILLDNAVKYSNEKAVVHIDGSWTKKQMTVSVSDEGIGIPGKDLPHVFQRFYRADASRSKRRTSGYGLGLSIAKQIVDQHRGDITIESIVNKGTTVTVTLPTG